MILSVKQLKAFKSASSFIKPNNLIPVLAYIKFDHGTVTKNNLHSFLVADMPGAEPMLVEELALWKAVENTTGDELEITQDGDTITIGKAKHQTISDEFPVNATPKGPSLTIDEILPDIARCATLTSQEEIEGKFHFVHIGNGIVGATDKIVAYYNTQSIDVPEFMVRREVAVEVAKLKQVQFSENDSYHFFTIPGMLYGFSKPEAQFLNLADFFKLPDNAPVVELDKSDVIAFNNYVIGYTPAAFYLVDWLVNSGGLSLSFNDNEWKKSYSQDVAAEIAGDHEPFRYNAQLMNKLLKALPDERVRFYRIEKQYYIGGDNGFVALIQGMAIL